MMSTQKLGWFETSQLGRQAQATLEQNGIPSTLVNMPKASGPQPCLLVVEDDFVKPARKALKTNKTLKRRFPPETGQSPSMQTKFLYMLVIILSAALAYQLL